MDASAKYKGLSLNGAIHQGPKLQNDLVDVLLRFRKNPIAIACDVQEMFLQELTNANKRYHGFLW